MERQDLTRFYQLFNIAFTSDKSLKSDCTIELKKQLLRSCHKVDPEGTYGYAGTRTVYINSKRIASLYEELFP